MRRNQDIGRSIFSHLCPQELGRQGSTRLHQPRRSGAIPEGLFVDRMHNTSASFYLRLIYEIVPHSALSSSSRRPRTRAGPLPKGTASSTMWQTRKAGCLFSPHSLHLSLSLYFLQSWTYRHNTCTRTHTHSLSLSPLSLSGPYLFSSFISLCFSLSHCPVLPPAGNVTKALFHKLFFSAAQEMKVQWRRGERVLDWSLSSLVSHVAEEVEERETERERCREETESMTET